MSCNGCRVLRKGCSESCVLRPCLQWIPTPEAQGHATVFVAKFFGRAGLMSCISNVPLSHRPALFQSLLYEACGRTLNPVSGAVGLLSTGNWNLCQAAVETVLRGGVLRAVPDLLNGIAHIVPNCVNQDLYSCSTAPPAADSSSPAKRHKSDDRSAMEGQSFHLDLRQAKGDFPEVVAGKTTHGGGEFPAMTSGRRSTTPSQNSEESGLSINLEGGFAGSGNWAAPEPKLLNLFF